MRGIIRTGGKSAIFPITVCIIAVVGVPLQAAIVYFDYDCDLFSEPSPATQTASFDCDLHILTITETIHEFGRDFVRIGGRADSPSTFTVIRNITNDTGVTWTGYVLKNIACVGPGGVFVEGSAESTKLQTITYPHGYLHIEFAGSPTVLDGESFTIQFDFHVPTGFCNIFDQQPIPEPATICLFGFGGLVLLRNRRAARFCPSVRCRRASLFGKKLPACKLV